jgi:hypothetical protein
LLWISYNWKREIEATADLSKETGLLKAHERPQFGYPGVLILLALGALSATLLT